MILVYAFDMNFEVVVPVIAIGRKDVRNKYAISGNLPGYQVCAFKEAAIAFDLQPEYARFLDRF
jgi:hypothetical protein